MFSLRRATWRLPRCGSPPRLLEAGCAATQCRRPRSARAPASWWLRMRHCSPLVACRSSPRAGRASLTSRSRCAIRIRSASMRKAVPCDPDQEPALPPEAAAYAIEPGAAFTGWLHFHPHGKHGNCYRLVVAENHALAEEQSAVRQRRSGDGGYQSPTAQQRTAAREGVESECAAP